MHIVAPAEISRAGKRGQKKERWLAIRLATPQIVGAAPAPAIACQVVRPSSRRGGMRASAVVRSARLSRL
jgi:hypothetical protein